MCLSLFTSCNKFKLSENDLNWQPYKVGDILVFKSNKAEIDSIYITEVESHSNPEDYLAVFSDEHEILFVSGELSKSDESNYNNRSVSLISMFADGNSEMRFEFKKINDSFQYPTTIVPIDSMKYMMMNNKKEFLHLNDVIEIIANDYYFEGEYDLQKFYWSKKYGYVSYNYNNGISWKLEKFIRNGKNILNKTD